MSMKIREKFVVILQGDGTASENKYVKYLEKEGINVKNIPVLSFNFINQEILQKCLCNSDCYSGIIFTSTRAVSAVSHASTSSAGFPLEHWKNKNNFSVGNATADSAQSVLNLNTYGSNSGNSENLCQFIIENCGHLDKPLLFPCSNIRKDTILVTLFEKGIPFEAVVCYETVPNKYFENLWQDIVSNEGLPAIIVFFSPSGVQSCIEIIKNTYADLGFPKFIAIGPSTEKALLEVNITCKTAEKPTPEYVVSVVKKLVDA